MATNGTMVPLGEPPNIAFVVFDSHMMRSKGHFNLQLQYKVKLDTSLLVSITKATKWHMRPAKTQISLGYDQSSLCAQWVAKNPSFLHADSEDSDQTAQMPKLI